MGQCRQLSLHRVTQADHNPTRSVCSHSPVFSTQEALVSIYGPRDQLLDQTFLLRDPQLKVDFLVWEVRANRELMFLLKN